VLFNPVQQSAESWLRGLDMNGRRGDELLPGQREDLVIRGTALFPLTRAIFSSGNRGWMALRDPGRRRSSRSGFDSLRLVSSRRAQLGVVWLRLHLDDRGVIDGCGVALCSFDGPAEQVDQAADVAAGGVGFVEDAVLADGLGAVTAA
jgi:hypothetical protein